MTDLLAAEARRFAARRAIRLLLASALLLVVVVNVVQLARAGRTRQEVGGALMVPPPQCVVDATARPIVVDYDCLNRLGSFDEVDGTGTAPEVVFVATRDRRPRVGQTLEQTLRGTTVALIFVGFVLGATYIAADYGTSLGTQLLFEPRRGRVLAAKLLTAAAGAAVVAAIVLLAAGGAQWIVSALRGSTAGADAAWAGRRGLQITRGAATAAVAAVFAAALSVVTRRTVVTLVGLLVLFIGSGFLVNQAWGRAILGRLPTNALFVVAIGDNALDDRRNFGGLHTWAGAWTIVLAWTAASALLASWWFARQEIR